MEFTISQTDEIDEELSSGTNSNDSQINDEFTQRITMLEIEFTRLRETLTSQEQIEKRHQVVLLKFV